ncbi:MAG: hypothetical protein CMJ95_02115 [Planctomycetes bacterium]|nr:hypothetical protein [Planctomycetota bacterium]
MIDPRARTPLSPAEDTYSAADSCPTVTETPDRTLQEMHLYMRLAREWDLRFEKLFRTGALSKWYSSVGNEATTVACASAIEAGDALLTLHRDSGAILRHYLDIDQILPGALPAGKRSRSPLPGDSQQRLLRLTCQMFGRQAGFSAGHERSYHYNHFEEEHGLIHIGMISHLGSMIPVAAGVALAFQQAGKDRVAINFIGEGATSTGDFHEGLNIASVWRLPFILVIENNQWAFSTPTSQQYACDRLVDRAIGYGIPGVQVDGNNPKAVLQVMETAVARARAGEGPTLIEAMLGRQRGHSEGDDSLTQVPAEELEQYHENDPLDLLEKELTDKGIASHAWIEEIRERCAALIVKYVDEAMSLPEPEVGKHRSIYAE